MPGKADLGPVIGTSRNCDLQGAPAFELQGYLSAPNQIEKVDPNLRLGVWPLVRASAASEAFAETTQPAE